MERKADFLHGRVLGELLGMVGVGLPEQHEASSLDQQPEDANPPTQPILHVERELLAPYDRRGIYLGQPLNITLTCNCCSY